MGTLCLLLIVISIIPIWVVDTLPLYDYPNHVARIHLLFSAPADSPLFDFYEIGWKLLPNLGLEIMASIFMPELSADEAARLFISLTFICQVGGVIAVNRAFYGFSSVTVLAAFPLLYSQILLMGFLSYLFGIGAFLIVFAGWVRFGTWSATWRLIVFSLLTSLLLVIHLYAVVLYAITVAGLELGRFFNGPGPLLTRPRAGLLVGAAQFFPTMIVFAALSPTVSAAGSIVWSSVWEKAIAWSYAMDIYHPLSQLLGVAMLVAVTLFGLWRGWIKIRRELVICVALLLIVFLVAPTKYFSGSFVTLRMPIAILFFLVAGLSICRRNREKLIATVLAILSVSHILWVTKHWFDFQPALRDFKHTLDEIQPGERVGFIMSHCGSWHELLEPPYVHAVSWAVIEREAFVPYIFASETQQPIAIKAHFVEAIDRLPPVIASCEEKSKTKNQGAVNPVSVSLEPFEGLVDVVLVVDGPDSRLNIYPEMSEAVRHGASSLYRLTNTAGVP